MRYLFGDIVDRNISSQIFLSLLIVMFAIGGIDFIFLILNELSDLSANYSLKEILIYSIKSMPYRLFDLTSYICLIGLIVGLGYLADKGELVGTQILGKSLSNIVLAAFRPVLLIMLLGLLASEFFIPSLSQSAEENRSLQKERTPLTGGYWNDNGTNLNFVKSTPERNRVLGLTVYELNEKKEVFRVIFAEEAFLDSGNWKAKEIEVFNINKYPSNQESDSGVFKLPDLDLDFDHLLSPKYLSLTNLFNQVGKTSSKYRKNQLSLEFWRKVFQPLVTFSLVLLAMSFLFGPMRDQTTGQRIVIGIGVAFAVDLSQKLLGSISVVSNIPILVAVIFPALLIICIALFLFKRV